jgi:hypothetical protein
MPGSELLGLGGRYILCGNTTLCKKGLNKKKQITIELVGGVGVAFLAFIV